MKLYLKTFLLFLSTVIIIPLNAQSSFDQSFLSDEFLEGLPPAIRDQIEGQNQIDEEEELEKLFRSETSIEKNKILLQKLQQQLDALKKTMKSDDPINIEGTRLNRYGENFFQTLQSSFMPINIGNLGPDYTVDVGDSFTLFLIGKVEANEVLMVQRDGSLLIPSYGKVFVAGLTLQQVEKTVQNFINSISIGVDASISLKSIRDVQVLVLGGIESPGIYTLSGGSNILGAINIAGGISDSGSYRNILLKRNGKTIQSFDLYDIFVTGIFNEKITLRSGDTIFVAPSSAQIPVSGGVSYPAIFEVKSGETLKDVISFAGGFSEGFSGFRSIKLQRVSTETNFIEEIQLDKLSEILIEPRDSVYVPMFFSANQTIKSVEIEGMVNRPGQYFINEGETLSNLIERAGGLKNNAYLYGSALFRKTARDQEKVFAQINYSDTVNFIISNAGKGNINKGILDLLNEELRSQNLPGRVVLDFKKSIYQDNKFVIENGDKIIIPALQKVVYLFGDFRKPSNLIYNPSFKVKDYLKLVGGVKDTAFNELIVIDPDGKSHVYSSSIFSRSNIEIYPGSIIYAPRNIGKLTGVQYASSISPILSSLAISLASLNSIKD